MLDRGFFRRMVVIVGPLLMACDSNTPRLQWVQVEDARGTISLTVFPAVF